MYKGSSQPGTAPCMHGKWLVSLRSDGKSMSGPENKKKKTWIYNPWWSETIDHYPCQQVVLFSLKLYPFLFQLSSWKLSLVMYTRLWRFTTKYTVFCPAPRPRSWHARSSRAVRHPSGSFSNKAAAMAEFVQNHWPNKKEKKLIKISRFIFI